MQRKLLYFILPIITLVLEILPYGAVCIFADGLNHIRRVTYSYFDLIPFGNANFAPLLTAIISCIVIIILIIYLFIDKYRIISLVKTLLLVALILSLCPLLYGFDYYSLIDLLITLSIFSELLLLSLTTKNTNVEK